MQTSFTVQLFRRFLSSTFSSPSEARIPFNLMQRGTHMRVGISIHRSGMNTRKQPIDTSMTDSGLRLASLEASNVASR